MTRPLSLLVLLTATLAAGAPAVLVGAGPYAGRA